MNIPFQVEFTQLSYGKGILTFLLESILQDHFIDDLATENASPSEKFFTNTIELFEDHGSATTIALHNNLQFLRYLN
jgi:CobQ-like glutamine amidotransferase family enzyme